MPQPLSGPRAKMNVHGTNPRARRDIAQKRGALAANERAQERIERSHAASERKRQRKIADLKVFVLEGPLQKARSQRDAMEKLLNVGIIKNKREAVVKALALCDWYVKQVELEALKKKLTQGEFSYEEREALRDNILSAEVRAKFLSYLIGENPSVELQKQILAKIQEYATGRKQYALFQ